MIMNLKKKRWHGIPRPIRKLYKFYLFLIDHGRGKINTDLSELPITYINKIMEFDDPDIYIFLQQYDTKLYNELWSIIYAYKNLKNNSKNYELLNSSASEMFRASIVCRNFNLFIKNKKKFLLALERIKHNQNIIK